MNISSTTSLVIRYALLLGIGILNLALGTEGLFYTIFTPLTIYPVYEVLHGLYEARLVSPTVLFFGGYYAELIPACIAGSAYFLLLILNLTTPMSLKKRIPSLFFLALAFLVFNIARIVIFGVLLVKGYQYFDIAHIATWYFGSTALVVGIWFANALIFRIKSVPLYTDLRKLVVEVTKKN